MGGEGTGTPMPGRKKLFDQIALPHLVSLYRTARQLAGPDKAEDLVQETLLCAWKHFNSFDPATNCRAWLFRILRNVWVSHWRKSRLELPLFEEGDIQFEPYYDWEDEILWNEIPERIETALRQLPVEYRWAILLADVEGFSYQEISRTMDCPIGTVMSRLNRGRRMLGRLLKAQCQSGEPDSPQGVFSEKTRGKS